MSKQINHSDAIPRIAVFDGTYHEILDLLEQARSFALTPAGRGSGPAARVNGYAGALPDGGALVRLEASCEALRVTSRLTHCLAWVLVHKAIHAGELSPDAAYEPENRLNGGQVCAEMGGERDPRLPTRLRGLLASSRMLYARLARLDARLS